jgi:hypothetical protein
MVRRPALALAVAGAYLSGCSSVPSLDAASGAAPQETNILIADVVRRVKCEIADAFDDKLGDRNFDWLWNWTAKVDLQLQVNETAGASPSGAYTHYYPNAFIYSAGSELINANLIGYFQQTFTLAGGVTYNGQAQRSETVSFTLPLQEVKNWRTGLDAPAGDEGELCRATGRELRGNLGLKEWVDSALYPVSTTELRAGIHPQAPEPPGPPSLRPRSLSELEDRAQENRTIPVARATTEIAAALRAADLAYQKTVEHQAAIATELASAQSAMQTTVAPDLPVLTDTVKRILSNNMSTLSILDEYARDDVEHAREARRELEDAARLAGDAARRDPSGSISAGALDRANELAAASKLFAEDARIKEQRAKRIADGVVSFKPNTPIDGLLHSVQFVVTYGGSISPTWTLLLWKGPGTLPGLSAQGVRTNSLNIALGPTSEQSRLITNQLISNVGTHP